MAFTLFMMEKFSSEGLRLCWFHWICFTIIHFFLPLHFLLKHVYDEYYIFWLFFLSKILSFYLYVPTILFDVVSQPIRPQQMHFNDILNLWYFIILLLFLAFQFFFYGYWRNSKILNRFFFQFLLFLVLFLFCFFNYFLTGHFTCQFILVALISCYFFPSNFTNSWLLSVCYYTCGSDGSELVVTPSTWNALFPLFHVNNLY